MHRLTAAGLALASLVLVQGRASAQDCACMGPELLFEAIDQVETPDHYATPPEELPAVAVAPTPRRATPVLWCLSANDPRCSRDDSGEAPYFQIRSVPPVLGVVAMPPIPRPAVTRVRFVYVEGHPLPGVRGRVDRPPRA